ncbi:hypothetical protein FPOAC1_011763 [Fusarium poae]|uniref:hypothetical protein n=1 Tax=Fusarium poae TaxID=36050 RepID=UPI001CEB85EA|nr:hypothetical protein FPOAC1_011763 [Fusarium poae]KAG8666941.1 hypothetical protein FPOAC1_011763 [Fusarium poae]
MMISESPLIAAPSGVNLSNPDQSRSVGGDVLAEQESFGPTPLQVAIAQHRTGIVAATVAGHFAHWQYLTRSQRIDVQAAANRIPLARLGLAWGIVYLGVLSTITVAQLTGTAAPILGYGALNALLFVSYNRTESALNSVFLTSGNMWNTWIAGAVGGLATWIVSTPTELIKCRAQLASPPMSSLAITKQIWGNHGFKGFYFGGAVTALRDSIGYGFYFWSYELSTRWLATEPDKRTSFQHEAAKVLFCGGLAGVVTWVSVFPLDVIKTRVQTQTLGELVETSPLLRTSGPLRTSRAGALQIAQEAYREGGARVFFRGLTVCSVRAFIVNAVQWAVYEWVMLELGHGRKQALSNDLRVEKVEAL